MSEPRWSKGKWQKQPRIPYVNCGDEGPCFGPVVLAGTLDEVDACASLLAATPDLYDALRDLLDNSGASTGTTPAVRRAVAALAKARGETP